MINDERMTMIQVGSLMVHRVEELAIISRSMAIKNDRKLVPVNRL